MPQTLNVAGEYVVKINGTTQMVVTSSGVNGVTLASPTITSPTIASPIISGTWSAFGATCTNLGTVTSIDMNGGEIDGAVIGGNAAAAITGTTITASTEFRGTILTSNSTSAVAIKTSGGTQFNVADTPSAVNYWQFTGGAEGVHTAASAQGTDSNINLFFQSKGSGVHRFMTAGGASEQLRINHTASAVSYVEVAGGATGSPGTVTVSAQGTDSDIDIAVTPKGIGIVKSAASLAVLSATAIPAGGTAGAGYKFSSTANFGVFFGSGAPTLAAAKGSLYLRSDGSGTTDRAYINTDGSTTWTALTTAA